jgi:hypothetical protein
MRPKDGLSGRGAASCPGELFTGKSKLDIHRAVSNQPFGGIVGERISSQPSKPLRPGDSVANVSHRKLS